MFRVLWDWWQCDEVPWFCFILLITGLLSSTDLLCWWTSLSFYSSLDPWHACMRFSLQRPESTQSNLWWTGIGVVLHTVVMRRASRISDRRRSSSTVPSGDGVVVQLSRRLGTTSPPNPDTLGATNRRVSALRLSEQRRLSFVSWVH